MLAVNDSIYCMNTSRPLRWPDDYKGWSGTIKDLADMAARVLEQLDPQAKAPNIRLLRYYQQLGVVGRGQKKGATAMFGFNDLERVVAAKGLVQQNWTLDQAVNLLNSHPAPVSSLLYGDVSAPHEPTLSSPAPAVKDKPASSTPPSASEVVARLMASSTIAGAKAPAHSLTRGGTSASLLPQSLVRAAQAQLAKEQKPAAIPSNPVQALHPAPWMTVYLDEAAARRASPADRQAAIDALLSALRSLS